MRPYGDGGEHEPRNGLLLRARHPQPVRCWLCDGDARSTFRGQPAHSRRVR
ncbi:MAG: hypothetical protein WBW73_06165 [Rhodoplanes sp.]